MAKFTIHNDSGTDDDLPTVLRRDASSSSSTTLMVASTPLLKDVEGQTPPKMRIEATPLPMLQLCLICLTRLAEPIAYTQIFPYINQMVEEMHITDNPSEIGFYSGLVDSLFAFAQLLTVYQWGRLSDKIGRRPVIITGLMGVALASTLFGLSGSLAGMLASRALAGMLSGNSAIMQSVLGEITDETNQAKAFPLMGVTWSLGCVIGPLLGGLLSHPAERYPDTFGHIQFLKDRPFFLPCFVSSCITVISVIFGYFFLEETLPRLVASKKATGLAENRRLLLSRSSTTSSSTSTLTSTSNYGSIKPTASEEPPTPTPSASAPVPTFWSLMQDRKVRSVLNSTFLLAFISMAWEVVFILFAYTPVRFGGLSKHTAEIGYALSSIGVFGIFSSVVLFPFLHDLVGPIPLFRVLMKIWPFAFAAMPLLNSIARYSGAGVEGGDGRGDVIVWIGIGTLLVMTRVACMAFGANMILVKSASPGPGTLGVMFGLSQSASSIARATAPAFVSSLFAISVDRHVLGGNMVWIVMIGISALGILNGKYLARA